MNHTVRQIPETEPHADEQSDYLSFLRGKVERAREDAAQGRTISNADVEHEFAELRRRLQQQHD